MSEFSYLKVDPESSSDLVQLQNLLKEGWKILTSSSYDVRWEESVLQYSFNSVITAEENSVTTTNTPAQYTIKEHVESKILFILTRNPVAKSLYGT